MKRKDFNTIHKLGSKVSPCGHVCTDSTFKNWLRQIYNSTTNCNTVASGYNILLF